jgi:hypothetical protein
VTQADETPVPEQSSPLLPPLAQAGPDGNPALPIPMPSTDREREIADFHFLLGWNMRQDEIDRLEYTADRLYAEMCRRIPPKQPDLTPFARLQEIRREMYSRPSTTSQILGEIA